MKMFLIFLLAIMTVPTWAADTKISALTNIDAMADADDFPMYDQSSGLTKKVGWDVLVGQSVAPAAAPTFESVKLNDDTTTDYDLFLDSNGDGGTAMAADRYIYFDVYNANRNIDLQGDFSIAGNFTVAGAYTMGITVEDANSSIVLDEQTFEVEGEGTASRLVKIKNEADTAATLTLNGANSSIDQDVSIAATPQFANVHLTDNTTAAYEVIIDAVGDGGTVLTADHTLGIDLFNGDRTLDLKGNVVIGAAFTTSDTYTMGITVEDANSSIVLDEQTFEVEGEGTASQLVKIVNEANSAATLTLNGANSSIDQDVSIAAAPTHESIKLNDDTTPAYNVVIDAIGDGGTVLTADHVLSLDLYNADRALDLKGNVVIGAAFTTGDTYTLGITPEDANSSIVLDEQSFEVEGEGTASQLFKLVNSANAARTLSFGSDMTVAASSAVSISAPLTVSAGGTFELLSEDTDNTITLDEASLEIEGEGTAEQLLKIVNSVNEARTVTLGDDLTISAGATQTYVAEDNNASITWDNANFEVENANATQRLMKLVVGTDAAATLTVEGTAGVIDQDLSANSTSAAFAALNISGTLTTQNGLITHSYDASVDDEAEVAIASGVSGWGFAVAGDGEEHCSFTFTSAGVVTKLADSSANCEVSDSDTDFCVYDAGDHIAIKNRLGSAKQVKFQVHY